MRHLSLEKRGAVWNHSIENNGDGYVFHCSIRDRDGVAFSLDLRADSYSQADRMRMNFEDKPDVVYRGIIAMEGTIKTLCPTVNIMNYFTSKVNTGFNFNLDLEHPEEMNPEIAMMLYQLAKGTTESATKTAETLDMLEKGQIGVHANLGMDDRTSAVVSRLTGYAVRALLIAAFFIGSCLLCTVPVMADNGMTVTAVLAGLGVVGYIISVIFAYRLLKDVKMGK